MHWLPIICLLGIGGWQVAAHYEDFFTSDPAQRDAVRQCFKENHQFDPRDSTAREACLNNHILRLENVPLVRFTPSGQLN